MAIEISNYISMAIRSALPILICGIGLVFGSRAGIVNIGAEGFMLIGAFMGVVGSYLFSSAWIGVLVAMLSSMLISLIFAYFTVTVKADQVVVGMGINMLAIGLTTTLFRRLFGMNTEPIKIESFSPLAIPGLSDIPILGTSLFTQHAPAYLIFLCIPLASFILFRTDIGLKVRAVGEHPRACDTVGINVFKVRYGAILFSGLMAGFAGAYLTLGLLNFFVEDLMAGRGYMAVAAVVFGKYSPVGVMLAALIFGAGDALQYRLQAGGSVIPYQFLLMIPYVLTILAICGFVGENKGPAAMAQPYIKE
ncbi:MAG: ABC transporter permease [Anaerolineaceae bacterium]|nr:ABC transporter permease [Anaerolineaceae bacterium]